MKSYYYHIGLGIAGAIVILRIDFKEKKKEKPCKKPCSNCSRFMRTHFELFTLRSKLEIGSTCVTFVQKERDVASHNGTHMIALKIGNRCYFPLNFSSISWTVLP